MVQSLGLTIYRLLSGLHHVIISGLHFIESGGGNILPTCRLTDEAEDPERIQHAGELKRPMASTLPLRPPCSRSFSTVTTSTRLHKKITYVPCCSLRHSKLSSHYCVPLRSRGSNLARSTLTERSAFENRFSKVVPKAASSIPNDGEFSHVYSTHCLRALRLIS